MRWAIECNNRWLYAVPTCWLHAVGVVAALYAVMFVPPPPAVTPWLHTTKTILVAILAMVLLAQAMQRPLRSWRRRRGGR